MAGGASQRTLQKRANQGGAEAFLRDACSAGPRDEVLGCQNGPLGTTTAAGANRLTARQFRIILNRVWNPSKLADRLVGAGEPASREALEPGRAHARGLPK